MSSNLVRASGEVSASHTGGEPIGFADAPRGLSQSDRMRIQTDMEELTPLHLLASRALEQEAPDAASGKNVSSLSQSIKVLQDRVAEKSRHDAEASRCASERETAVKTGIVSEGPSMAATAVAQEVPALSAGADRKSMAPHALCGDIDWETLTLPQRYAKQREDDTINRRSGISIPRPQAKGLVTTLACNMLEALDPDTDEARRFALEFAGSKGIDWMSTLARVASREISFCGLPISSIAQRWLENEFRTRQTAGIPFWKWQAYLTDMANRGESQERMRRCISAFLRHNIYSHAFESTSRRKRPDTQKCNGHSVFRCAALAFEPQGVSEKAVERNRGNHPVAGESREMAVRQLRSYLANAGFKMFDTSISSAARDLQSTTGERPVFDIKDLMHADPSDPNTHDKVITIVDQDYYLDDLSAFSGQKIVIITREYNKLAGRGPDSTYYYTAKAREGGGHVVSVTERVGDVCGAAYTDQRPWNYSENDLVYIQHRGGVGFTSYNVHTQYQPGTTVKFVWLCPQTTVFVSHACITKLYAKFLPGTRLAGTELRKADNVAYVNVPGAPIADGFIVGMFGTIENPIVSIKFAGTVGPNTSVEMSELDYKDFVLMANGRASGYGLSEVRRVMQRMKIWREGGVEAIVAAYFKIPIAYRPLPNIMYTSAVGPGEVVQDVAQTGSAVPAAPNIAGGAPGVADTGSEAAFTAYKEKRKDAYANKTKIPVELKKVMDRLLIKFCELVSQETGVDKDSVGLQDRSVIYERRVGNAAVRLETFNMLNLFKEGNATTNLKTEVVPKASVAPRGVTQYNEDLAIETGLVGLLVKEILKSTAWYQPGSTPGEIAAAVQRVAEVASEVQDPRSGRQDRYKNSGSHDTDFSKLDETYSEDMYRYFVTFTLYFTLASDKERVEKILMDNVNLITEIGAMLAKTGWKNNSGSGITTELNTFFCAFEEFVNSCFAIAMSEHERSGEKPYDWSKLTSSKLHKYLESYSTRTVRFAEGSGKPDLSVSTWVKSHLTGWRTTAEWEAMPADERAPYSFNNVYQIPYFVIGPKFGDDGIGMHMLGISDLMWGKAADYITKAIGMVHEGTSTLKVTYNTPDDPYFFLGRYYPAPNISTASYSDVLKAIRKLSIAKNSEKERYVLKLHGYWTTDCCTPVLSEYLQAVARLYGVDLQAYVPEEEGMCPTTDGRFTKWAWEELDVREVVNSDSRLAKLFRDDRDMFYRVARGVHRGASVSDTTLMHEAIAKQLDMTSAELTGVRAALQVASTWEEIDAIRIAPDWDPDAEPAGTVRVDGPIKSLLDPQPSSANDAQRLATHKRASTPGPSNAQKKIAVASAKGAKLKRLLEEKRDEPPDSGKKGK